MARDRLALAALLAAGLALAPSHRASAASPAGVRLVGTVVSSDAARSLAVIESGGATRVLRTGADLDGAQVLEIRGDAVLLRRGGNVETLTLASQSAGTARPSAGGAVPASPAGVDDDDVRRAHETQRPRAAQRPARPGGSSAASPKGAQASARDPSSARGEGEVARSNDELLAQVASQARFAAVNGEDGKLRGVAVMNVMSDSLLERLGLRSDDVVVAIQGTPIDSSGRAMAVARGLSWSAPVRLDIERHGVPTVVTVDPRAVKGR